MNRELKVSLIRLDVDEYGNVKWTKDLLEKLKSSNEEYNSDETIIYHPARVIRSKPDKTKYVEPEHGTTVPKQLIRAHPSRAGFRISVHGIRCKKKRTYLACKIPGCKASFQSVRDWNSHHRLLHKENHLTCMKCKRKFNTPSFLRDHAYVHSKIAFRCNRCDITFAFKSQYKLHVCTHLRSRIHKCFAGSCGKEYKWPQDLHHHIQAHLKLTYGCNICDYSNSQKYLLNHHQKKHNDVMYYHCKKCDYECKWYTQLSRHSNKCNGFAL